MRQSSSQHLFPRRLAAHHHTAVLRFIRALQDALQIKGRWKRSVDDNRASVKNVTVPTVSNQPYSPVLVAEDLFAMPPSLNPEYSPLQIGWLYHFIVDCGIFWMVLVCGAEYPQSQVVKEGFRMMLVQSPLYAMTQLVEQSHHASWVSAWQWIQWIACVTIQCLIVKTLMFMGVQEMFFGPSRISTETLRTQYSLPSTLSRFEKVPVEAGNTSTDLAIHWLQYDNATNNESKRILHFSHGFGANSLSFLPCFKRLANKLRCRKAIADDKLGFGFTELPGQSPNPYFFYSFAGWSRAAASLLKQQGLGPNDSIVLVGHSMGALSTLRLALELPENMPKKIIFVAPAFGMFPSQKRYSQEKRDTSFISEFLGLLVEFLLRRLVGLHSFWRIGLSTLVWADFRKMTDADVLRFQWHSIHEAWEPGLVQFAKALRMSIEGYDNVGPLSENQLLAKVLALPNTTLEVIHGENDRIVSCRRVRKFLEPFANVRFHQLAHVGHDPFEEDIEAFLRVIE